MACFTASLSPPQASCGVCVVIVDARAGFGVGMNRRLLELCLRDVVRGAVRWTQRRRITSSFHQTGFENLCAVAGYLNCCFGMEQYSGLCSGAPAIPCGHAAVSSFGATPQFSLAASHKFLMADISAALSSAVAGISTCDVRGDFSWRRRSVAATIGSAWNRRCDDELHRMLATDMRLIPW